MRALGVRFLAQEDIQSIVDYYDQINSELADNFLSELYLDLDLIQSQPQAFQAKYRDTHVYYMKRWPFGIHYRFNDQLVEILAVFHTSRNPRSWDIRS